MTHEHITKEIAQFIQNNLVAEGVTIEALTCLPDLGLDSFSMIEILLFIERKFGVSVPDEMLNYDNTETASAFARCTVQLL